MQPFSNANVVAVKVEGNEDKDTSVCLHEDRKRKVFVDHIVEETIPALGIEAVFFSSEVGFSMLCGKDPSATADMYSKFTLCIKKLSQIILRKLESLIFRPRHLFALFPEIRRRSRIPGHSPLLLACDISIHTRHPRINLVTEKILP